MAETEGGGPERRSGTMARSGGTAGRAKWARVAAAAITGTGSIVAVVVHNYREDHADPGVLSYTQSVATELNTLSEYALGAIFSGYDVDDAVTRVAPGVGLRVDYIDDEHYEITDQHGRHPACLLVTVIPGNFLSRDRVTAEAHSGACPRPAPTAALRESLS